MRLAHAEAFYYTWCAHFFVSRRKSQRKMLEDDLGKMSAPKINTRKSRWNRGYSIYQISGSCRGAHTSSDPYIAPFPFQSRLRSRSLAHSVQKWLYMRVSIVAAKRESHADFRDT